MVHFQCKQEVKYIKYGSKGCLTFEMCTIMEVVLGGKINIISIQANKMIFSRKANPYI